MRTQQGKTAVDPVSAQPLGPHIPWDKCGFVTPTVPQYTHIYPLWACTGMFAGSAYFPDFLLNPDLNVQYFILSEIPHSTMLSHSWAGLFTSSQCGSFTSVWALAFCLFSLCTSFFFFLTFLAGCIDCCLSVSARGLLVSKGCSSFPLTLGAAHRGLHSVMCFEATVVTLKVTNWNIQDLNVVIKPDIMYKLCFFFFFFHRWVGWKWNDNKGKKIK